MSRSPTADSSADDVLGYDAAWAATNKLVRAGHSFSGRERNCAFLNLGSQRFANVSGVTALDLIDDGRGMALCDWDWDGRLDFWLTNRTGPRVRFLHNRFASDHRFIAIRLRGRRSNRDAVGARVEIRVTESAAPLIRTVYCGSGFLSQSSKWLHFGLGNAESAGRVRVRWPGGEVETWTGLKANTFYEVEEGRAQAEVVNPPQTVRAIESQVLVAPPLSGSARVVVLNPSPLPEILYTDADGLPASLDSHRGNPLLVHLWATWCPNCKRELTEWGQVEASVATSGLRVLALCVDDPGENNRADLERAAAAALGMDYKMPLGLVRGESLEILNVLQKAYIGRQTDLPLPSSFLIDARGRLAVIYKGPVSADRVLEDLALLGASPTRIVAGAAPGAGRWLEEPRGGQPRGVAMALVEHGMHAAAEAYLRMLIALYDEPDTGIGDAVEALRRSELTECHIFLGAIAFDDRRWEDAAASLRQALEMDPLHARARDELVRTLLQLDLEAEALAEMKRLLATQPTPDRERRAARILKEMNRLPEAISLLEKALERQSSPESAFELANVLRDAGRVPEAIRHYRSALKVKPGWALPANNLAWILATSPDVEVRNGAEAVRHALAACEATQNRVPQFSGTLAAAYAEAGDFSKAVEEATRSIALALESEDAVLAARLAERRALYESGSAFRDTVLGSAD